MAHLGWVYGTEKHKGERGLYKRVYDWILYQDPDDSWSLEKAMLERLLGRSFRTEGFAAAMLRNGV